MEREEKIKISNMSNKDKKIESILNNLKSIGKAKAVLFKFTAKEVKKSDITRFINLFKKLGVRVEVLDMSKRLKGERYDLVVIDEKAKLRSR
ncbi:MAG TPA: hypothetical protein VGB37_15500 [Candidatus Lokiarchaeia archaeon]